MSLQPFSDTELNYFKFASIVLNEFANALRQTFKSMWNNTFGHRPGYQLWDDSTAVRNLFLAEEGGKSKVPTHHSYEEWDCTALFQTTIYAKSFAMLDSRGHERTLGELYLRHLIIPHGKFHVSVVSPSGNQAETFTLAIDQLRLLRNSLCHLKKSEINKPTFDRYMQLAKEAFKALGIKTDPIDAIGSLTESDFPTTAVRNLEQGINQELRERIKFLEGEVSSIDELKALTNAIKEKVEGGVTKEDFALLEKKMDELKEQNNITQKDSKTLLLPSCLPPMVPHFAGRQRECEDVVGHVASTSTRIVSIWGSPGFGKTSVATAVGHKLQDKEFPVYFFSLRGLNSKTDLISKLLSVFRRASTEDEIPQRLPIDEELFQFLAKIADKFVMILDNADDLLESGEPDVKENFIQFLKDILSRSKKATFVITTRESLEFMNVHFEGHHAVRIRPLDDAFSQALVSELLPNAIPASDCEKIAKICGNVPLAIWLLCPTISKDSTQPSQFLEDWKESVEHNIVELLDNPDYPSNLRLKILIESSFRRLSVQEKEALVSLSILSEDFNISVAAAVMGIKTNFEAKKILYRLQRKSLLDSGSKPDSFSMHKLLQSFVRERGEDEMKETTLDSKARFSAFFVSLFEELNKQFLTGHSKSASVKFYEEKQNIIKSLTASCSDPKTCDTVFSVLIKAEIFLDSLFWCEGNVFNMLYESAINQAKKFGKSVFYKQLLVSLAFNEVHWGTKGRTMKLLSDAEDEQMSCSSLSVEHRGKLICYRGICQVASGKTDDGVRNLEEAFSLMTGHGHAEKRILRVTASQVLALCHRFKNQFSDASSFYNKALQECRAAGNTSLLIIPPTEKKEFNIVDREIKKQQPGTLIAQPLRLEIIGVVCGATQHLFDDCTRQSMRNAVIQMAEEIQMPIFLRPFGKEHANTAKNYESLGATQYSLGDYASALQFEQHALDIRLELFGEEHSETAQSYESLGVTQHNLGDFASALRSKQHALAIRVKLFGKEHPDTAKSYQSLGAAQNNLGDYASALQSAQHALSIRVKLFGEEHPDTAQSYESLGVTQHNLGDFASALRSEQHALDIRVKLLGEEHPDTAQSYESLGVTQHNLGDFASALRSKQHALDIRVKLLGEEHPDTAQSYESLGVTQHNLGDFASALRSKQHALAIRVKLFGKEHPDTAKSYQSLGAAQNNLGDYASALQSAQHALSIRVKLFGEEHSDTAQSYESLGVTQHNLGDFASALRSKQHALDIRVKLLGEEHPDTAQSYESLGVTQHNLGDFASALRSKQHALDIRVKLFGKEHPDTAQSYKSLGVTQQNLGDFASALRSKQRALDIRVKLFGKEHPDTAQSYQSFGVTQHNLGDYASALQSVQHALDIRVKVFGKEHPDTAQSYQSLGVIQHNLGDYASALQSVQHALDICVKVFGKEHPNTAQSYQSLGVIQHELGDYASALQSKQHALDTRVKLFGKEHPVTAMSYLLLINTQRNLGDIASALQSTKHALDVHIKMFGKEHPDTAKRYESRGVTQHNLGDYASQLQSKQHALDILVKLFGKEHADTARIYHLLGVKQHNLGDFASALQSKQHALDIRVKLLGEEHADTARSYESLGVTQHNLGDYASALQSKQHALDIRIKLLGEEHADTARSYESLSVTQHNLGDYASALRSKEQAFDIRTIVFHCQRSWKFCAGGNKMANRVSRKRKQIDYKALHESSTADIYQVNEKKRYRSKSRLLTKRKSGEAST